MKNSYLKFIVLILFWIAILLSIGSAPSDILYFGDGFFKTLISLRIGIPIVVSSIIILYYIAINAKSDLFNYNNWYKLNFLHLFFIYIFFQLLGLFERNNKLEDLNLENTYLVILASGALTVLVLIKSLDIKKKLIIVSYFTLFIIFLSGLTLLVIHILNSDIYSSNYFSLYNSVPGNKQKFLNHELPRVTGISRTLAVLNIFIINIFFICYKKKQKYLIYFFSFFLGVIIFAFQSRGTIICFVASIFILLVFLKKITYIQKIKYFALFLIVPFILFESARLYSLSLVKNSNLDLDRLESFKNLDRLESIKNNEDSLTNFEMLLKKNRLISDNTTSGRLDLWRSALKKYNKEKIFGYGPQADRFLLLENVKKSYSNNVSNAYIYAFLCSGYFGLISFVLIVFKIFFLILKKIFFEKIFYTKNCHLEKFSILVIIFLLIRSIFENSFSVFGIDFILFTISTFILIEKKIVTKQK